VRDGARGLVWYTVLAFGLSWAAWGAAYALGAGLADPLFSKANWLAAFAPAVAAIVVRRWITGEGFADVGWGVHLRRKWPYYLVALLYPLVGIWVLRLLTFRWRQVFASWARPLRTYPCRGPFCPM